MLRSSLVTRAVALQHSKWPEATGELGAKEKAPGAVFNVAQRRPAGRPPEMAGHKKPAQQASLVDASARCIPRAWPVTGLLLEQFEERDVAAL
ncbi:MAG: hypothetical protein VCA39_04090, partial [Pseudomonas sp.]|uniref:hypothetical protein n=1 Tax=Pseudomonas sp. TaxID=306 RepID=UPI003982287C